jgi:hypothetical protein
MNLKFKKYWGECNLLMAIGAILDPSFKIKLVQFCSPKIYQKLEATTNIKRVRRVLNELYGEYVNDHNWSTGPQSGQENVCVSSSTSSDSSASIVQRSTTSRMAMFQSFVRSVDTFQPVKSDLEVYLKEDVYICDEGANLKFDALE